MASGHHDPKLLYAINGVNAYHIANGYEESLTPAGPQTLSLLMVPTSSPFADVATAGGSDASDGGPQEDFYLHLHLPPELDLPLPATTQIYHQPPTSYLIPRWDLGPDSGAFTRIEFPPAGSRKGIQEDVDTFETILAQCTSFLERQPAPKLHKSSGKSRKPKATDELPAYNPADFGPGEAYVQGSHSSSGKGGQIVLVDEEDGSVIGELGEGFQVVEDSALKPGSKDPVEITLPTDGSQAIAVTPASQQYVDFELHPAYKKSFLVSNAALASRLIVTTSDLVARALANQADSFTHKSQATSKPVTFNPSTHSRVRKVHNFSASAAGLSSKTVGQIGNIAQNLGAHLAGHKPPPASSSSSSKDGGGGGNVPKGYGPDGKPLEDYKPGFLNRSLMAFSTIADGIDQAGRNLLTGTTNSVTTVVTHKWGPEAGELSRNLGGGFKNVGLVYIDVTGVSRKAILKSVAKGMVVGRVSNGGGDLIVGGGDGGVVTLPAPEQQHLLTAGPSGSSAAPSIAGSELAVGGSKPSRPSRP